LLHKQEFNYFDSEWVLKVESNQVDKKKATQVPSIDGKPAILIYKITSKHGVVPETERHLVVKKESPHKEDKVMSMYLIKEFQKYIKQNGHN
jgi:hypothetical protein